MERKTYSLDNTNLSQDQKIAVESWFQFPGVFMEYTYWFMAVLSVFYSISLIYIFLIPILFNVLVGYLNWFFYNKKLTTILALSLFHPWVTGIVGVGVATFLFLKGSLFLAIISAFVGIFSFLFLELHIILYSILAQKYNMHPKYVFAKRKLGYILPLHK